MKQKIIKILLAIFQQISTCPVRLRLNKIRPSVGTEAEVWIGRPKVGYKT